MNRRNLMPAIIIGVTLILLTACKQENITESENTTSGTTSSTGSTYTGKKVAELLAANAVNHEAETDYTWNNSDAIAITLNGTTITAGTGVTVSGSTATITTGGIYSISGTLANGQIIVNSTDSKIVRLILNGVNITNTTNAPINIQSAEKTIIVLADNTQNYITDGSSYVFPNAADDEPNAAIYSKSDLTFYGNGSLTVKGNYNDGIAGKDGLVIKSGNINVTAVDDGIRGKDYLVVKGGTIAVNAKGDGLKSDNEEDSTKGYIYVATGTLNVTSGGDAITAQTDVLISDGSFTITSGGGSSYTASATVSSKGIKGLAYTAIDGGNFNFNTADDAIHSNKNLAINGGTFSISSGDDGIHADANVFVDNGTINITKSYEGIESASITINNGSIHIISSDDGINGAGGVDGSAVGGRPGQGTFTSGNYSLYINGGYIFVNAVGDGIDINGFIVMTGGSVIVNGPTNNGNGPLDYDSSFKLTGGFLLASGSAGMAQAPGTTSTQYSVLLILKSTFPANTLFHIQASDGTDILSFVPKKAYQSVAFSSSKLANGKTYDVYYGGSYSTATTDGLYENGTYSGGTKYGSFTVSGITTRVNM